MSARPHSQHVQPFLAAITFYTGTLVSLLAFTPVFASGAGMRGTLVPVAAPTATPARVAETLSPWLGVCYGTGLSSSPLAASDAIGIIQASGFSAVKLYSPDPDTLNALAGTGMEVFTMVPNDLVAAMAASDTAAQQWVDANITPFIAAGTNITTIGVGNEVVGNNADIAQQLVPAMEALYRALQQSQLENQIRVVTTLAMNFLANTYPPSSSEVIPELTDLLTALLSFAQSTGSAMVLDCYPFFAYSANPSVIPRDFAFFENDAGYDDNGIHYQNLFEAEIDGALWAFEKLGFPQIPYIVGEVGWPTAGADVATVADAGEWITQLIAYLNSNRGTPKRPGQPIRAHIFEMFDEDLKDTSMGAFETSWGLNTMDGSPKYPLTVSAVSQIPAALALNTTPGSPKHSLDLTTPEQGLHDVL